MLNKDRDPSIVKAIVLTRYGSADDLELTDIGSLNDEVGILLKRAAHRVIKVGQHVVA